VVPTSAGGDDEARVALASCPFPIRASRAPPRGDAMSLQLASPDLTCQRMNAVDETIPREGGFCPWLGFSLLIWKDFR
jgi:hypothetical protein